MEGNTLTSSELGIALMEFIGTLEGTPTAGILAALSIVTATIACEAGYEEEKAVYAFRKSYGEAKRRIKRLRKEMN
jgi:hypothetical protein|tara:strand:- start:398 stop:625 length:228 start_codon:yes stop_codon:yes gene_type:complete